MEESTFSQTKFFRTICIKLIFSFKMIVDMPNYFVAPKNLFYSIVFLRKSDRKYDI